MDISKHFYKAMDSSHIWSVERLEKILNTITQLGLNLSVDADFYAGENWASILKPYLNLEQHSNAICVAIIRMDMPLAIVTSMCDREVKKLLQKESIYIIDVPDFSAKGYSIDMPICHKLDPFKKYSEEFNPENFSIGEFYGETID